MLAACSSSDDIAGKVGGVVVSGAEAQSATFKSRALTVANDNLTVLSVDGKKLALTPPKGAQTRTNDYFVEWRAKGSEGMVSDHMKHSRYGMRAEGGHAYLFAQGDMTPASAMPTAATPVHYLGGAMVVQLKGGNDLQGTSEFTVNFAEKKLDGNLVFNEWTTPVQFANVKIDGNRFKQQQGGQVIDGAFFGKDAAELAGVFYKTKDNADTVGDFLGAFGAKKH